ncbi:aspartyl protease family protein [Hyphococcus sp.]|uniref:aspartyl protease family protein n=1 Tax=Hyphococcus sp. TaxID=2038636 RepID=UPI003D146610
MKGFQRLFRCGALAAAFAAVSSAGASAHPLSGAEPQEWVPYRIDYQGWITVNANVNGDGPNDFIVDSGATITSVFANLAEKQDFQPAARGPIRILGLASAEALPAYILGEITVGHLTLDNHVGVILPDWAPPNTPPQGVVGLDLLTRHTVMIDEEEGRVKFYDRAVAPDDKARGWTRTNLKPLDVDNQATPLYLIDLNIRGFNVPCVVDLGASGTIFNGPAFRAMTSGVRINSYGLRSSTAASNLNDIFDNTSTAKAVKISRLKIGGARWRNQIFLVYDAEVFRELGAASKPFCLVGMDLFADRSIIFDFANEHFYIGPERN